MKFAIFLKTLFGLCCLASVCSASSEDAEVTTLLPNGSTTEAPPYSTHECYIEKSKASQLLISINRTVQILSKKDGFIACMKGAKIVDVLPGTFKLCSEERIEKIQDDLTSLTASLFEMAIQRQDPEKTRVLNLETEKLQLIDRLHALRLFYGPPPCDGSNVVLFPFDASVDQLETSLDSVLALLQTTTTSASSPPTSTPTSKPTIEQIILNPNTTFAELLELDISYPEVMSTALAHLIPQRYANVSNFDAVLNFVKSLSTSENQIMGFSALYEAIRPQQTWPSPRKLIQLAESAKQLYESVSSSSKSKLKDLMTDLSVLIVIWSSNRPYCYIINVAYESALITADYGRPKSAYLSPNGTLGMEWRVRFFLVDRKINFGIGFEPDAYDLGAAYQNPNDRTSNTIYNGGPSQGYVLSDSFASYQRDWELEWKFVPVEGRQNTFRILTAKAGDFMFAHDTATGFRGYRRVLLAKAKFQSHSFIRGADHWYLDCSHPPKPDRHDV